LTFIVSKCYNDDEIKRKGRVGLVLQNPDLMLFTETVWKEISFGLKQKGLPSLEIKQRVGKILSALNLEAFKERLPHALSRGQRLRVAVASVLALEPEILLLDEPTSGQDTGEIEGLMRYLHTLKKQGKNIVFITHDLDVAYKWADRVLFMEKGEIIFCGGKGARH
jgi:energy-coupling factor transport system ATP-binding protein